jgi:hypothetical protein
VSKDQFSKVSHPHQPTCDGDGLAEQGAWLVGSACAGHELCCGGPFYSARGIGIYALLSHAGNLGKPIGMCEVGHIWFEDIRKEALSTVSSAGEVALLS